MIVLITMKDYHYLRDGQPDYYRGKKIFVSHGIDIDTMANMCVPCEELDYYIRYKWAEYNDALGEYVLTERVEK